jgi:hypothetical protein
MLSQLQKLQAYCQIRWENGHVYCVEKPERLTERRDRVVNTPASYSGGPGFKSLPGDRLC